MEVFESLKANLVGKNARIVLPEGEEPRILQATKRLVKETEVIPVLLGNPEKIKEIQTVKSFLYRGRVWETEGCPNGIRRGGFAHSRKTVRFKVYRWNASVYSSVQTS